MDDPELVQDKQGRLGLGQSARLSATKLSHYFLGSYRPRPELHLAPKPQVDIKSNEAGFSPPASLSEEFRRWNGATF